MLNGAAITPTTSPVPKASSTITSYFKPKSPPAKDEDKEYQSLRQRLDGKNLLGQRTNAIEDLEFKKDL